jgi:transcriptional regulator with XRE-family HTH domain
LLLFKPELKKQDEGRHPLKISAERLRTLRARRFWSQEELAERAGVSRATIYKAEGGAGVAPKTGRALAQALGIPSEELFEDLVVPKAQEPLPFDTYERSPEQRRNFFSSWTNRFADDLHTLQQHAKDIPGTGWAEVITLASQKILDVLEEQGVLEELRKANRAVGTGVTSPEHAQFRSFISELLQVMRGAIEAAGGESEGIVELERYRDLAA